MQMLTSAATPSWSPAHLQQQHSRRLSKWFTRGVATSNHSTSSPAVPPSPAEEQQVLCLKEWAVTCAALGTGQQMILLRKGGIREAAFTPKASRFLLFPTAFHTDAQLLKPGVAQQFSQEMMLQPKEMDQLPLEYYAEVTGAWTTADPHVLTVLDPLHVYAEGFLETRLKWRSREPLTLLELRCYRLQQPLLIPVQERSGYFGCFSWVELEPADAQLASWQMQAALDDKDFTDKQDLLRRGLTQLQADRLDV